MPKALCAVFLSYFFFLLKKIDHNNETIKSHKLALVREFSNKIKCKNQLSRFSGSPRLQQNFPHQNLFFTT